MDCIGKGTSRRNFFKEESNFHVKETATETGQDIDQEGPHDGIATTTRIIIIYVAARHTFFLRLECV
jgi:hypothetical protein